MSLCYQSFGPNINSTERVRRCQEEYLMLTDPYLKELARIEALMPLKILLTPSGEFVHIREYPDNIKESVEYINQEIDSILISLKKKYNIQ